MKNAKRYLKIIEEIEVCEVCPMRQCGDKEGESCLCAHPSARTKGKKRKIGFNNTSFPEFCPLHKNYVSLMMTRMDISWGTGGKRRTPSTSSTPITRERKGVMPDKEHFGIYEMPASDLPDLMQRTIRRNFARHGEPDVDLAKVKVYDGKGYVNNNVDFVEVLKEYVDERIAEALEDYSNRTLW